MKTDGNSTADGAQELCESRGGRPGLPPLISQRFLWSWCELLLQPPFLGWLNGLMVSTLVLSRQRFRVQTSVELFNLQPSPGPFPLFFSPSPSSFFKSDSPAAIPPKLCNPFQHPHHQKQRQRLHSGGKAVRSKHLDSFN